MLFRSRSSRKDQEILEAFRAGDDQAFHQLYSKYQKAILRYVSRRVRDREAAQDICQEIFLRVHCFRGTYQPRYAFSTWLWTIARNVMCDWRRKGARTESIEVTTSSGGDGGARGAFSAEEFPANEPNAEMLLMRKSERRRVKCLLKKLTHLQRRVIWLRLVRHLSYEEIAKDLGVSLSAVKCLLHRARQVLERMDYQPAY